LFRYDPYSKEFTREYYDIKSMHTIRQNEINKAANGQIWGLVLGSLGRQGSPKVLEVKFYFIFQYMYRNILFIF
jgi:2-(3-amino-3-carboxypropyl)histidine synthase